MAQQPEMSLLAFQKKFNTEESCRDHLFKHKWPNGFICGKCGHPEYYFVPTRNIYQCKKCSYQETVTSNTVMHRTHTFLIKWFWAIYLAAKDKRGISATGLSKQIDVSYPTAWLILHKIRNAMKQKDGDYKLANIVEIDEAFFGGPGSGGKRGRGSSKSKVLVGISLTDEGKPQFAKMKVVENIDGKTVKKMANENIEPGSTIKSDGYSSYKVLTDSDYKHSPEVVYNVDVTEVLHWVHIVISNAKAFINGTYHGLGCKHLQKYLDEYCYRFNRRFWENQLFDRLLRACSIGKTTTYSELTL